MASMGLLKAKKEKLSQNKILFFIAFLFCLIGK